MFELDAVVSHVIGAAAVVGDAVAGIRSSSMGRTTGTEGVVSEWQQQRDSFDRRALIVSSSLASLTLKLALSISL